MVIGWFCGHWDGYEVVLGPLGWLWGGPGPIGMVMGWFWGHWDGYEVVLGPLGWLWGGDGAVRPLNLRCFVRIPPFSAPFPTLSAPFCGFQPFPPRFPQSCSNRGYPPEGSDEVRRFLPPPDAERFHFTALGAFKVSFSRNNAIYP